MSTRTPTASAIAKLIGRILPAQGAVPDDIVRTAVRQRLSPVSDEMFRAAVILGRARGDFVVGACGTLARREADAGKPAQPAPEKPAEARA